MKTILYISSDMIEKSVSIEIISLPKAMENIIRGDIIKLEIFGTDYVVVKYRYWIEKIGLILACEGNYKLINSLIANLECIPRTLPLLGIQVDYEYPPQTWKE